MNYQGILRHTLPIVNLSHIYSHTSAQTLLLSKLSTSAQLLWIQEATNDKEERKDESMFIRPRVIGKET